METLEKIWWGGVTIAEIGIVLFWAAGFSGNLDVAQYAFFGAGIAASVALAAQGLRQLRRRHGFY